MNTSIVPSVICFLIYQSGLSQWLPCQYHPTTSDYQYMNEIRRMESVWRGRTYEDNVVKVVMYRIRHDDGSGAYPDSAFAEEINNMNSFYTAHDICFTLCRIVNIDSSSYINQDWNEESGSVADSMMNVINQTYPSFSDALTIYMLPPERFFRGSAYGIPSTAFFSSSHSAKWTNAQTTPNF